MVKELKMNIWNYIKNAIAKKKNTGQLNRDPTELEKNNCTVCD